MILTLKSIRLNTPLDLSGDSLVLAELILPRNGIARRAVLKDITLSKGKRSLIRAPFYERALLKEKVDGSFGLKVSITRPLKHPKSIRFFRRLLATGVESSADLFASSIMRHSVFQDVAEEAGEFLADSISDPSPSFIAEGGLDLHSESLQSGSITIPLTLLETIRSSEKVSPLQKREQRKTKTKSYRKGSPAGEIVIQLDAVK